ncbi:MAG: CoA transferase, partial [Akkermansiaceae bacterium]|nr:CoA transferase [Akkermansiaceae bacterium]
RILPSFDVVIENFRPDVMEALGLGAESLLEMHPRLVYCGVSGFGADGPYANRPGFDQIAQGMSGFMSLTGTDESGPTRAGIAICDLLGGIFAAHGVQLALLARERTGRGQVVHTSLLEAMVGILSWGAG